jgi:hypothetical protein
MFMTLFAQRINTADTRLLTLMTASIFQTRSSVGHHGPIASLRTLHDEDEGKHDQEHDRE